MGVAVAPLTSAVMGSVEEKHTGVAYGVNNAVSCTAGDLAVAVVGAVALILFSNRLVEQTMQIDLAPDARSALLNEADRLGAARVPDQVAAPHVPQVETAIKMAFVDAFKTVLLIATGLAWIGTLLVVLTIRPLIR